MKNQRGNMLLNLFTSYFINNKFLQAAAVLFIFIIIIISSSSSSSSSSGMRNKTERQT
jgi:hypothetical protein